MPIPAAPDEELNSIATIVTHILGSEAETLLAVAGVESVRDRSAEFRMGGQTAAALLAQVDGADALLKDLGPALTPERLEMLVPLPVLVDRHVVQRQCARCFRLEAPSSGAGRSDPSSRQSFRLGHKRRHSERP